MTRVLPFAALAATALTILIAWQRSGAPNDPAALVAEATAPKPSIASAGTPAAARPDAAERVRVALDRPLFSQGRRPATAAPTPPPAALPPPRLTALLAGPFGRRAIFTLADRRSVTVDGTNAAMPGGWTVVAIGAASVVVAGPEGERTLVLGPGPPPLPPPPAEAADPHETAMPVALPKGGPVARGPDQLPFPLR